jgi:hypothetical protein
MRSLSEIHLTMTQRRLTAYFYFSYGPLTGDHGGARL